MSNRANDLKGKMIRGFIISAVLKFLGAIAFLIIYLISDEPLYLAVMIILLVAAIALVVFMQYMLNRLGHNNQQAANTPEEALEEES